MRRQVLEEHPLYVAVADAVTAATGVRPFVNALHTSSDIRVPMVQHGAPPQRPPFPQHPPRTSAQFTAWRDSFHVAGLPHNWPLRVAALPVPGTQWQYGRRGRWEEASVGGSRMEEGAGWRRREQ